MRIAALYDIHGNYPALEAVVQELHIAKPDKVVIGGDIVSGPMPNETMKCLMELGNDVVWVLGNGDVDVSERKINGNINNSLSEQAKVITEWVANIIDESMARFLISLPINHFIRDDKLGMIGFCHATPNDYNYVFTPVTPNGEVKKVFNNEMEGYFICGHTHIQFEKTIDNLKIVNAGSVGMPFSEEHGAEWLLLENGVIRFMKTKYDIDLAKKQIKQTTYPFKDEFIETNVINPKRPEEMIPFLERMRTKESIA
jgi:predicted phosphodiesterase